MVKRICDKCKFLIKHKFEAYHQIDSFQDGRRVHTGYMHKSCNDKMSKETAEQNEKLLEMLGPMVSRVNAMMDGLGLPEVKKTVVIK